MARLLRVPAGAPVRANPEWRMYGIDSHSVSNAVGMMTGLPPSQQSKPFWAEVHTTCGRTLRVNCSNGNPHLCASPEAVNALHPGGRAKLAVRDGEIVAIGETGVFMHPVDVAIQRAYGLDVDQAMDWARTLNLWWGPDDWDHASTGDEFRVNYPSRRFTALISDEEADLAYEEGNLYIKRVLPETVLPHLVGRPLGDLMEVPELADLDLPIVGIANGRTGLIVTLVDEAGWVPIEQIEDAA